MNNLSSKITPTFRQISYYACCCRQILILLVLLFGTSLTQAESLVPISTVKIPPLPTPDSISHMAVINGQPVAFGMNATWVFNEEDQLWESTKWQPQQPVISVAGDGERAFLLVGDSNHGPVAGVEQISLTSGVTESSKLPQLPQQLISASGAVLGDRLFIAGHTLSGEQQLLAIDLLAEQAEWISHPAWPTKAGNVTSLAAQYSVLLVTLSKPGNPEENLLQWHPEEGWSIENSLTGSIIQGSGRAIGQGHILYLVTGHPDETATAKLMSYQTITGSWAQHGELDADVSSNAVGWKNGVLWAQANKTNGTTEFSLTQLDSGKVLLAPLDWAIIIIYLFGMLGIGLYFYTRHAQDSEAEFFLGGRSIPFWAAGISLYVSNASSISYIAVPAKAFATNWQYLLSNLIVVVGLMFVAVWVVPLLRRLNLMSVFHYLETRFHPSIRVLSSALFIIFQLGGRMTVILFLPALAISTVTGFDVVWSIIIMGGVTIVYTVLGGMKAVIWTDFVQLFVMFGGTFFAIGFVIMMLDGGTSEFLATALADDKLKLIDWSFDLTEATIWGFIFLVLFDTVLTFPKDQVLMQRILSTGSAKEAGKSVWTFALIVLPASVLFYLIGTALYVFYQSHPERMDPSLSIDATFPLFIAAELPIGVTGLIIAGIFAASMSTLSSILNSVATLTTVDFYEKFIKYPDQRNSVRFAELVTVVGGFIGVGLAILLSRYEIHSLLDLALELWGLLGGGFAGAYTLGMFTRRANWQGVAIGVAISIIITLIAWSGSMVHPYFYLPLSVFVCIVTGYAASWLFPPPSHLEGLTVFKKDLVSSPGDT